MSKVNKKYLYILRVSFAGLYSYQCCIPLVSFDAGFSTTVVFSEQENSKRKISFYAVTVQVQLQLVTVYSYSNCFNYSSVQFTVIVIVT